jgi:hypothetical protein
MPRLIPALLLLPVFAICAPAAVFQYQLEVPARKGTSTVHLWIPAAAERVRGVVVSGMTLMEKDFSIDPVIRAVCADEGLAIIFSQAGLGGLPIPQVLADFAAVSGYAELAQAPLFLVGHSAGGPQAKQRAIEFADRCFGLCQYRGGAPDGMPAGIPTLMMVGQYDEFGGDMRLADGTEQWMRSRDGLATWRAEDPARLASLVVEPGAGHFAWSERSAAYLALFLREAAHARLPAEPGGALRAVDPATGWLTDLGAIGAAGAAPAAAATYAGDRGRTSWHGTEALAQATVAYHTGISGKQDQFIRWQDPHWIDAGCRFFFTNLTWVEDGATLEVHPVYAETVPAVKDGPRWHHAGTPVGHAAGPIRVRPISGPLVAVGDQRLRLCYDNVTPAGVGSRPTFMAYQTGDDTFRHTEQVGMMPRGWNGLTKGADQVITFPELADRPADEGPVPLAATSDAGLPVSYYVATGPAVIKDGALVVAEVPRRATFPILVTVVAWQPGRGIAPEVKGAAPVARSFKLLAPPVR